MSVIITGMISTRDGLAITSTVELSPTGRGATEHRRMYNSPAIEYRSKQPATIGVDIEHDGHQIGEVKYLALRPLGLYAVLEIDDTAVDDLPFPMYLSSELEGVYERSAYSGITLNGIGIVARSANIAKERALVVSGDLDTAHCYHRNPNRSLLKEACEYDRARRYRPRTEHRIHGARGDVEILDNGLALIDGEPVAQRGRGTGRGTGRFVPLPGGGYGEIEYSAHRGKILSVR